MKSIEYQVDSEISNILISFVNFHRETRTVTCSSGCGCKCLHHLLSMANTGYAIECLTWSKVSPEITNDPRLRTIQTTSSRSNRELDHCSCDC